MGDRMRMRDTEWAKNMWKRIMALLGNVNTDVSSLDTGKADKVAHATGGNFAGLDSNGNLTDSGKKPSDFLTSQDIAGKKNTQSPVSDPTASGTSVTFISNITQDAQGVVSPSKKTVPAMSGATSGAAGSAGLVPAPAAGDQAKYLKGDGTWGTPPGGGGAVSGVKGNAEATYRTGDVNLTPANIGAQTDLGLYIGEDGGLCQYDE